MSLLFLAELETSVEGSEGYIYISQQNNDESSNFIKLTIHQFQEIYNRSKQIIADAQGESE